MTGKRPEVFLAVPTYGPVEPELIPAIINAGSECNALLSIRKASLLSLNFNSLWCMALNNRDKGFEYFAMLHADIFPMVPGWLSMMIDEMHAAKADVLGVVSPLKDNRGLTSVGWLHEDHHVQRLTMKEVYDLPETWTAESLGVTDRKVVINTGLWICDFTKDWVEKVYFHIKDDIQKCDDGRFKALTLSEDWFFSQQLANLDLTVALTRKIPLSHFGRRDWQNTSVWGSLSTDVGDQVEG